MEPSSREGVDSLDMVLVDIIDSWPLSLSAISSSKSSGGLSRKSRGLFPSVILNSFSETPVCWSIASTVNRCPAPVRLRAVFDFCGGMEVMASNAATDGGNASGE